VTASNFIEGKSLDDRQLATVARIISGRPPGTYTVRELFGDEEWRLVIRKRAYGQWFKRSVERGHLPRIRHVGKKSNRSLAYEVLPESVDNSPPDY
jgi:Domain of unknown function (DUF1413)